MAIRSSLRYYDVDSGLLMFKIVLADGKFWLVAAMAEWPESAEADARLVADSKLKRAMRHWHAAAAALGGQETESVQ